MPNNLSSTPLEVDSREGVSLTIEADPCLEEIRRQQRRERHVTMLIASLFVLLLSFTLSLRGSGSYATIEVAGIRMPSLCTSRSWFGVECPGCGLTRSFVALASGNLVESLQFHRLGWLLFLAVVLQVPYRLFSLRELKTGAPPKSWPPWFGAFLIAALIGNWLLKITLY